MAITAVLIPANGFRGETFLTYSRGGNATYGRSWEVLEGEDLAPGREITRGGLQTMLATGAWRILPRNHPARTRK